MLHASGLKQARMTAGGEIAVQGRCVPPQLVVFDWLCVNGWSVVACQG